jgi:hypothetical protein
MTAAPQQTTRHRPGGAEDTKRELRAPPRTPTRRSREHTPAPPVTPAREPASARPDGGRKIDGLRPLWVFLVACLTIVGAVRVTDAVNSGWILVPVMAVFFIATFGVLATIMWQLRDNGEPE